MRNLFDALGALSNTATPRGSDESENDSLQKRYRTIFISDLHLGTPGCQAALQPDSQACPSAGQI